MRCLYMISSADCFAALLMLGTGIVPTTSADAQALTLPSRSAKYGVDGVMMGNPMEPWSAQWIVRDTTIDGTAAVAITQMTLHADATASSYSATALLDRTTGHLIRLAGQDAGRSTATFSVSLSAGRIQGSSLVDGTTMPADVAASDSALPSIAVPFVVAAGHLADGQKISIPVFTYQSSTARVFQYRLSATVSSNTYRRPGASEAEPVWIVQGNGSYAAKYIIAKSDLMLLLMEFPQGTVGTETNTYAGP